MAERSALPDDPHEMLDLLDEHGEPLARGKARADVHRDGDWHRAFHLWVVRPEGHVLLQRRSKTKDLEPNRIDVSVAGHYRFGETVLDVAREAEEEIGMTVRPGDLAYLTTIRSDRTYPDAVDREWQEVYACRDDRPLNEYRSDCAEVAVLYDVPLDRLLALVRGEIRSLPAEGHDCQDRVNNALLIEDDLIGQARTETAHALECVRRWAQGEGAASDEAAP